MENSEIVEKLKKQHQKAGAGDGRTVRICGLKTAKYWEETLNWTELPEDKEMQCLNCDTNGATALPLLTWQSNMHYQVGSDPVCLIREDYRSQLCRECRTELIAEMKESGDFHDQE